MQYISAIVTFITFFIEGLLHYNIGLNSKNSLSNITIGLPNRSSLFYMIIVLMFFSFINAIVIDMIHKYEHATNDNNIHSH